MKLVAVSPDIELAVQLNQAVLSRSNKGTFNTRAYSHLTRIFHNDGTPGVGGNGGDLERRNFYSIYFPTMCRRIYFLSETTKCTNVFYYIRDSNVLAERST